MERKMKLLRCDFGDGIPKPGIKHDDKIVNLTKTDASTSDNRRSFIGAIQTITENGYSSLKSAAEDTPDSACVPTSDVTITAPVAESGRFFALGGVYTQHLRERNDALNKAPSQWVVPKTAIVGPGDPIVIPERVSDSVMPAVELCIVIGKQGRHIEESDVSDHIAGYTISNDITARTDWPGPMAYKLMDTFSPCGPGIVPANCIDTPTSLEMNINQGGERICQGSTASMRFTIPFLVSFLSSVLELRPGDVISTGDPGRVQQALAVGETVQASIENVGELKNPIKLPQ